MTTLLEGFTPYDKEDAEKYAMLRWWPGLAMGDILDKAADIYPDKEAFVDGVSRATYFQARENANKLALGFLELDIKPLDRVLVQLPNWNEFVYTYFALQKIGAIVVLLIDRYRQHEIIHLARLTEATVWIVPETYRKTDYRPIIEEVVKENPRIRHVITVRGRGTGGLPDLARLLDREDPTGDSLDGLLQRRPDPGHVAHMAPTGGTTGLPKIVPRTHDSLLCGAEYAARAWEMEYQDVCLLAGPIGHDLTFTKGLCGSMFTFGKTVFLDSTDAEKICETVEKEKVTAMACVPTLAKRLIDFDRLGSYDLGSLKKMYCGGGASLPAIIRGVVEKLGCTYFNGYGGTEGQTTMTRSHDPLERILHSVGKPTCPYDTYKVVDLNGNRLPPHASGELLIKGPGVFTGYYKSPSENESAFNKDGYFRTGDLARIDEKGYVTLTGRIKEMINRGGESISAAEIENLIIGHPGVAVVAVIPMPDPDLGERICAYIQPKPGAELSFEGIVAFLRERGASVLHLPERIEFVEAMPLTKANKVDKKTLRNDIETKLRRN